MDHLLEATLAVFAGSIVEGILGFGCSLVWMSFFPLFTTIPDAVGVLQPMHIALNIVLLGNLWQKCTPKDLRPLAFTVPFGIVFGLWIVTSWSSTAIDCVLGIFLIAYTLIKNNDEGHGHHNEIEIAAVNFDGEKRDKGFKRKTSELELDPLEEIDCAEEKKDDAQTMTPTIEEIPHAAMEKSPLTHRHPMSVAVGEGIGLPDLYNSGTVSKNHNQLKAGVMSASPEKSKVAVQSDPPDMIRNPTGICAGLVGGALMGAFGTGGPAFLIYAREAGWQKHPEIFRANLQLLFCVINVPVCLSQFAEGIITYERCKASCYLLPALLAGSQVGGMMASSVSKEKFQILVVNGLRIMGLMFLIESTRAE